MSKKVRMPIAAILLAVSVLLRMFQFPNIRVFFFYFRDFMLFLTPLTLLLELVLCCVLFAKKRDNILVIVFGCSTLVQLVYFIRYFRSISYLLDFVAYGLMFVFVFVWCEQTLIKADLSGVRKLADRLFYLPAIIYLVSFIYRVIRVSANGGQLTFLAYALSLLAILILLTLAMWLKNPCGQAEAPAADVSCQSSGAGSAEQGEYGEGYCGLIKHVLLCMFTFGIWYLIWIYRTTKFLNKAPNAKYYKPGCKLLLCMFIPFYQIYWYYKHGQRIDGLSGQKGLVNSDMASVCLFLGIFIPMVGCIIMQDRINVICTLKGLAPERKTEEQTMEDVRKYKDLLDSGIITEEEFAAKKKQLLGL